MKIIYLKNRIKSATVDVTQLYILILNEVEDEEEVFLNVFSIQLIKQTMIDQTTRADDTNSFNH